MQITSRFTIAVHSITAIDYFHKDFQVTSNFLAKSVGANPVIIRNVMGQLKNAGIIAITQGKSGIELLKPIDKITFYDVYKAVDCLDEAGLFHFHENPSFECPIGRVIHSAMDDKLQSVQDAMEQRLREITVADVMRDAVKEMQNEPDAK
ncbi:MAG: Rrf2 family transcriptional regulator [Clostridia bacterium]|nr:Rrf2 family transcriptional regulator [Clostridia bacterium]